jgi:hypothetical protein
MPRDYSKKPIGTSVILMMLALVLVSVIVWFWPR